MRRITLQLLAVSSLTLLLGAAQARTRPHYGDALRADTQTVVMSGDKSPEVLSGLVFENLVTIDNSGHLQPGLATSWSSANSGSRWEFALRQNLTFHDGTPLKPADVVRCLSKASAQSWRVRAASDGIVIESDTPLPNLPAIFSLPEFAIYFDGPEGALGTGPYRLDKRTGPLFSLRANDDYWAGRPFLDGVELLTSRSQRDQLNDFLLERAEVVELAPENWRRAQQERMRTASSKPIQLIYLAIDSATPALRDPRLSQAISLCIDRGAIQSVIFQHQGEIAASLLPNWLSGYAFLFDANQDISRARQLRGQLGPLPSLVISYDPNDPEGRLIAERVALNAHDAGINLQPQPNGVHADIRVRSANVASLSPSAALAGLIDQLGAKAPIPGTNAQSLYDSERAALETYSAIPLVFVPRVTALRDRVRNWADSPSGAWQFESVWLARPRTETTR